MKTLRLGLLVSSVAIFALAAAPPARAQACSGIYRIEQSFPGAGTSWLICWTIQRKYGPIITSAHFRRAPAEPWIRVFWDARIGEIFVPYHDGVSWRRYYDVTGFDWDWVRLNATDCPPALGGTLLGAPPDNADVCKIVHDRGIAWKDDTMVRRGQELVLWGALDAANYNYLIEWTFRDDGVFMGRIAATGVNLPSAPFTNHMHTPTWRLDIDLNGFWGDSVHLGTHREPLLGFPLKADDPELLIDPEAGIPWDPAAFNTLHVHDATLKNGRGNVSMLHLMPQRAGNNRHYGAGEEFTKNDMWVTVYNWTEMSPRDLPKYIVPPQPSANTDIVVWYSSPLHHLVRDEDGNKDGGFWTGEAHAMWVGFILKPHNLFDSTPMFP
jgi:Cu2+-containing amine oxidase